MTLLVTRCSWFGNCRYPFPAAGGQSNPLLGGRNRSGFPPSDASPFQEQVGRSPIHQIIIYPQINLRQGSG